MRPWPPRPINSHCTSCVWAWHIHYRKPTLVLQTFAQSQVDYALGKNSMSGLSVPTFMQLDIYEIQFRMWSGPTPTLPKTHTLPWPAVEIMDHRSTHFPLKKPMFFMALLSVALTGLGVTLTCGTTGQRQRYVREIEMREILKMACLGCARHQCTVIDASIDACFERF